MESPGENLPRWIEHLINTFTTGALLIGGYFGFRRGKKQEHNEEVSAEIQKQSIQSESSQKVFEQLSKWNDRLNEIGRKQQEEIEQMKSRIKNVEDSNEKLKEECKKLEAEHSSCQRRLEAFAAALRAAGITPPQLP